MSNPRAEFFANVYRDNVWKSTESRSGQGSEIWFTRTLASQLPKLLSDLGVTSMLDLPCGDFHWMNQVDLENVHYVGADIVPELIEDNRRKFARPGREFRVLDIVEDTLPAADLIFVRDCFIHCANALILKALRNIAGSQIKYMCVSTLDARMHANVANIELERARHGVNAEYRPIILENPPYALPEPAYRLRDGADNAVSAFSAIMGVWEVASIRSLLSE